MFKKTREKIYHRKTKIEKFFIKYKPRIMISFFMGGFVLDTIMLSRIDTLFANFVLTFYLVLVTLSIFLTNWGDYKDIRNRFMFRLYTYAPFITQFSFGALFSGFAVFYTSSATLSASWPFMIVLYFIFIANEKFDKFYERFEFQVTILFLSLFAFAIFFVPVMISQIGDGIFLLSGLVSLLLLYLIIRLIFRFIPILKRLKWKVLRNVTLVFLLFNVAYFSNIIPPVPLSIKNTEVAHMAGKNLDGEYSVTREVRKWNDFYDKFYNVYYRRPGEKIYFYASVFAPTGLETEITHQWQKYDDNQDRWVKVSRVSYDIKGGRDGGYRGYSFLSEAEDGEWRVDVLSKTELLIGREDFEVVNVGSDVLLDLETEVVD